MQHTLKEKSKTKKSTEKKPQLTDCLKSCGEGKKEGYFDTFLFRLLISDEFQFSLSVSQESKNGEGGNIYFCEEWRVIGARLIK